MTATDPLGCASSQFTTVNVAVCDSLPDQVLHIYSGITPNNDGHNDLWIIDGVDQLNGVVVSIYNRWGQLVWQKSGYDNVNVVWNGHDQHGDPLPDGTYYYVLHSSTVQLANWVEVSH
jgi:gliding motility-associated-like protein